MENAGLENARTDWLWKDDQAYTADTLKFQTLIEEGCLSLSLPQKLIKRQIKGNGNA